MKKSLQRKRRRKPTDKMRAEYRYDYKKAKPNRFAARMKKARVRITEGSGNVFLDLGFPPHEAAVMLLRCELAEAVRKWMAREGITQAQASKRLGVAQLPGRTLRKGRRVGGREGSSIELCCTATRSRLNR